MSEGDQPWLWFALGYALSVLIETPVLLFGLARRHGTRTRLLAGLWLTACTYPVVFLVLPVWIADRGSYLLVAETFAPVAECALFWMAFGVKEEWGRAGTWRDFATITGANLLSFAVGEGLIHLGLFG